MTSLLDIGINSLYTSRQALSQSHHNIANANNPFYSRRAIDLEEITNNIYGSGVRVGDIRRIADEYANQSLINSQSQFAFADKTLEKLNELEMLLDNDATGLNEVINQSLSDLNNLNANASSGTDRSVYLQKMQSIVDRFNGLYQSTNELHNNARQSIKQEVRYVNDILQKLRDLNQQIGRASSPDAPENLPLLDQRDSLLNDLAEHINFKSQTDDRGVLNLQVGNGVPLLINNEAASIEVKPSSKDPMLFAMEITNGQTTTTIDKPLGGGKISSLMSFQQDQLEPAQNALGRLALGLADAVNTQNKLGIDLQGELGQNLFLDINATDVKASRVIFSTQNIGTGTLSVEITDVSKLTTSDYELQFDNATDYTLVRTSDQSVVSSGTIGGLPASISVDGFDIDITAAAFTAGDRVLISPTRHASGELGLSTSDGSKIALAWPVVTEASLSNQGSGSLAVTEINDVSTPAFSVPKVLSPPVRVEFTSALSYRLVNANDDSVIEAGIPYDPDTGSDLFPSPGGYDPGYQVHIEGAVEAGDTFNIMYNQSGVGDNRNGLKIAEIYKQGILNDGEFNLIQAYNAVSGDVSSKTNSAKYQLESQEVIKAQAQQRRDRISGVSIEEETLNVARFEQSYVASAQILEVFKTMFHTVMSMIRN